MQRMGVNPYANENRLKLLIYATIAIGGAGKFPNLQLGRRAGLQGWERGRILNSEL
jgi:hypothetical protein